MNTHDGERAEDPLEIPNHGWWQVAKRVRHEMRRDHVTLSSAGVAFFGFSAMVPAIIATVSIYGLFRDPADVAGTVDRLASGLPTAVATTIADQLEAATTNAGGSLGVAAVISIAIALWSASSGVTHLMEALNIAYDEDPDDRSFFVRRGIALAITFGVIVLFGAISVVLGLVSDGGWVIQVVAWLLTAIVAMAAVATLYRYAADRAAPRFEWTSAGAVFTIVGWIVASVALRIYVARFGSYDDTYGPLATVVILLLWLYVMAFVMIVGAELNAELEHQTARDTTTGEPEPMGQRGAEVADSVAAGAPESDRSADQE